MQFVNKSWTYYYEDNEIYVENFVKFRIKKHSGEIIKVNGESVYVDPSGYFGSLSCGPLRFERIITGKNGNSFKLKVFMGFHLGFLLRCHIFINDKLVGGDTNKELYCPSCHAWGITLLFAMSGATLWCFIAYDGLRTFAGHLEIKNKIISNAQDLYQKEINVFFKDNQNLELKNEKLKLWGSQCESKSDYTCRLTAYLMNSDGRTKQALGFDLQACDNGHILSCYSAYLNDYLFTNSSKHSEVLFKLKVFCLGRDVKAERDRYICAFFSKMLFNENGDTETFRKIITTLCEAKYEQACEYVKWLNQQEIILE